MLVFFSKETSADNNGDYEIETSADNNGDYEIETLKDGSMPFVMSPANYMNAVNVANSNPK